MANIFFWNNIFLKVVNDYCLRIKYRKKSFRLFHPSPRSKAYTSDSGRRRGLVLSKLKKWTSRFQERDFKHKTVVWCGEQWPFEFRVRCEAMVGRGQVGLSCRKGGTPIGQDGVIRIFGGTMSHTSRLRGKNRRRFYISLEVMSIWVYQPEGLTNRLESQMLLMAQRRAW